jgi:hypothetical protein
LIIGKIQQSKLEKYAMRLYVIVILIFYLIIGANCQNSHKNKIINNSGSVTNERIKGEISHEDLIPDEKTAITIAETVLIPIYGKEQIDSEKPFHAQLSGDIWTVEGSLPEGWVGGVASVKLSKKDARVIKIEHGL